MLQNPAPELTLSKARQLQADGKTAEAEALCLQIVAVMPEYHPAHYQLALAALAKGDMQAAANSMVTAVGLDPDCALYRRSLCEVYRRMGQLQDAAIQGREALRLEPNNPAGYYNLGVAFSDSGDYQAAAEGYRAVLKLEPRHNFAANNLGVALEKLGDLEGAEKAYAAAIAIDPTHAEAQNNLGALRLISGDTETARRHFRAAIDSSPFLLSAHYNLSNLKKYTSADPDIAKLEALALHEREFPVEDAVRLWFALGKAREDTGNYDAAFKAYQNGNILKRNTFSYDKHSTSKAVDDVLTHFSEALAKKTDETGYRDDTSVFVIGMPRSGTTLIEQILSSHSAVHGAGELTYFADIMNDTLLRDSAAAAQRNIQDCLFEEIGKSYATKLRDHHPSARYITDKMPGNFFYAGFVSLALPNAKIIHVHRNPMDTCFSNYGRLFNQPMPYAYDLQELGSYYKDYKRLMNHWREILPAGTILDVCYEEVVGNLEHEARRLIDYLGLPWERQCVDFHRNKRPVKTASAAQVREPIYGSSVARWKKFAKHLGPLLETLGEEAGDQSS